MNSFLFKGITPQGTLITRGIVVMVASGITLLSSLSACSPPSVHSERPHDKGRPIEQVREKTKSPFKTIVQGAEELLQSRGEVGQYGGTFYSSTIGGGPKTFNPWASFDATSSEVGNLMLSGLVATDAYSGQVTPYLAKDVKILEDQRTYVVTLRKGLTWSDGQPLTAKDVVFTWNKIIRHGLGNPSSRESVLVNGQFPQVWSRGKDTIVFRTAAPWAPFLRSLSEVIAPAHIFEPIIHAGHQKSGDHGDEAFSAAWSTTDAANHPEKFVSSGIWMLDRYYLNEQIVYKRNPKFFMVDKVGNRLPYLDRYVLRFVKDQNNGTLQFEQGKLDYIDVPGQHVSHFRYLDTPQFHLVDLGPTTGTTFLTLNLNNRIDPNTGKPYVNPIRSRWFRDPNFRKAIDWTLDRQVMVNNILKGVGDPLYTAESLVSIYLDERFAHGHPRGVDQAKQFLKDSGFYWNASNELFDSDGNRVEFTLLTNTGNDQREATGVSVKQDLEEIGIRVNFKPLDFNVLVGKIQGTKDWEAVILALTGNPLEPHSGQNVWKSHGPLHMFNQRENPSNRNIGEKTNTRPIDDRFDWEKRIDELIDEGPRYVTFADRKKIYDELQEVVYHQRPFIYLFSPRRVLAVKDRVKNFDPTPLQAWHNLEEIWVAPSSAKK